MLIAVRRLVCAAAASCDAAPTLPLSNGSWSSSCAGSPVGQPSAANCTWGGAASCVCLVTGAWSTAITGQCAGQQMLARGTLLIVGG